MAWLELSQHPLATLTWQLDWRTSPLSHTLPPRYRLHFTFLYQPLPYTSPCKPHALHKHFFVAWLCSYVAICLSVLLRAQAMQFCLDHNHRMLMAILCWLYTLAAALNELLILHVKYTSAMWLHVPICVMLLPYVKSIGHHQPCRQGVMGVLSIKMHGSLSHWLHTCCWLMPLRFTIRNQEDVCMTCRQQWSRWAVCLLPLRAPPPPQFLDRLS